MSALMAHVSLLEKQPPVPAVMNNCIPDPIGTFGTGVALAVLLMLGVGALAWMMAAIPGAASSASLLPGASSVAARRVLRLDALDGLRTILVMYIVIYHVRWALPPLLAPWFQQGHWAVQFFFVLSGFVATCTREDSAGDRPISMDDVRKMTVRRITRLCPAYFVALLCVAAVVAYRGGGQPFLAWPIQALLLQSLLPVKVCGPLDVGHWSQNFLPFAANGEGWFVSAIFLTSLCFPFLYSTLPRGGFAATVSALVIVVAARSLPTFLTMQGWCPMDTYTFAPVRLMEFAAGMLSAQLCKQMPAWISEFGGWDWIFDLSLICAGVPIWFLHRWSTWAACEANHGDFFLTGVFCLTCIAARGFAAHHGKSPLSRFLASPLVVVPAAYSYQAFIYQEVFIAMLGLLSRPLMLKYWWMPIPLTWTTAVISVHLLEEPLKRAVEARLAAARTVTPNK